MDNETIVAISSPSGNSLRGMIRLSGNKAFKLVQESIKPYLLTDKNWQSIHCILNIEPIFSYGCISKRFLAQKVHIPVTLYLMHAPSSYTSEDIVEIHTFGSQVLLESITEYFISRGAKLAAPGEFTKRAFLNGRINLSQAEAVLNIIHSSSEAEHTLAVSKLSEDSFVHLKELRKQLIDLISRMEIALDFSDQDVEIILSQQIKIVINYISVRIKEILENNSINQLLYSDGIICILCGKSNVGKSSLFNKLVVSRKNIVSSSPGTTRDYIEGQLLYHRKLFRIFDTAGLFEKSDEISLQAQDKAKEVLKRADIFLMVLDISQKIDLSDLSIYKKLNRNKTLLIINKIDKKHSKTSIHNMNLKSWHCKQVPVSAYTGRGIIHLKKMLWELVSSNPPKRFSDETVITMRHLETLRLCLNYLNKAKAGLKEQISYEFIILDLKHALDKLDLITGADKNLITDDILNNIFSDFCIGK
jgi:tRNA modification GTPase